MTTKEDAKNGAIFSPHETHISSIGMKWNLFSSWLKRGDYAIETPEGWEKCMQEILLVIPCNVHDE